MEQRIVNLGILSIGRSSHLSLLSFVSSHNPAEYTGFELTTVEIKSSRGSKRVIQPGFDQSKNKKFLEKEKGKEKYTVKWREAGFQGVPIPRSCSISV